MLCRITILKDGEKEVFTIWTLSKRAIVKFLLLCKENRSALALEAVSREHLFLEGFNRDFEAEIKDMQSFGGAVRECDTSVIIEAKKCDIKYRLSLH